MSCDKHDVYSQIASLEDDIATLEVEAKCMRARNERLQDTLKKYEIVFAKLREVCPNIDNTIAKEFTALGE